LRISVSVSKNDIGRSLLCTYLAMSERNKDILTETLILF